MQALKRYFSSMLYVRVETNRFLVRDPGTKREMAFHAQAPFTTERLLIGRFLTAEALLRRAFRETLQPGLFTPSPRVLIQPLEKLEGGLSEVEERVFREVAMGAGARKVVVWVGRELGDEEVAATLVG